MGEKRYANAPLLYIQQPSTQKIDAKMQHNYVGKRAAKQATEGGEEQQVTRKQPVRQRKGKFYGSTSDTSTESETIEGDEKKVDEKPFQKMSLDERLDYVLNRPSYAPRLVSEMRTEERIYRGIIKDYKDGIVTILSGKRRHEVPFEEVIQIRLLSL